MAKQPKVSVIIPVWNVEKYIRQCLESVVAQTLKDIEIIVADDRGQDNSMEIAREFVSRDPRIKIVVREKNGGLSAARNSGMAVATAPWVMFVDSDDWIEPEYCEKMLNMAIEKKADMVVCGVNPIMEIDKHRLKEMEEWFKLHREGDRPVNDTAIWERGSEAWNKIYSMDIIRKNNLRYPEGLFYEDAYFYRVYMMHANRIAFVPEPLYNYRICAGSIMDRTKKKTGLAIDHVRIAINLWNFMKAHGFTYYKKNFVRFFHDFTLKALHFEQSKPERIKIIKLATEFDAAEKLNANIPASHKEIGDYISVTEIQNHKKISFAGIPIMIVRRKHGKEIYRLFGVIPVFVRKQKYKSSFLQKKINPKLDAKNFTLFNFDDTQLLQTLKNLGKFAYVVNPGNMGDTLISSATMRFFDKHKLPWSRFDEDKPAGTIVYAGGAIWIKEYEQFWLGKLPMFAKAKRVVILPSSFNNCQKFIDVLDERFTVFCREKKSFEYLKSAGTRAEILLDHDMAFRMDKGILQEDIEIRQPEISAMNMLIKPMSKLSKIAKFMRTDNEKAGDYENDMDLPAYACSEDGKWTGIISTDSRQYIDFLTKAMLCAVDSVDVVISDRLHVCIAGALMGKQVYMLDNSYGKLSNVYEYSMKDNPNVHFCAKMPKKFGKFPETATDNFQRLVNLVQKNDSVPEYDIFFALNDPWAYYLCVTMVSILENNPESQFNFHVITREFSENNKRRIAKLGDKYKNFKVDYTAPKHELFANLKNNMKDISIDTYYRYAIGEMFPNVDVGLYLDADLVVNGKLDRLMTTGIDSFYAGGVECYQCQNYDTDYACRLGLKPDEVYVNAGVLLLNLKKMRDDKMMEKLLAIEPLNYQDQDGINLGFRGKIRSLSDIWNMEWHIMNDFPERRKSAVIIHYNTHRKPWRKKFRYKLTDWLKYPQFKIWHKYARKTNKILGRKI